MISKIAATAMIILAVFLGYARLCKAEDADRGPKEMVLRTEKDKASTPKPAVFPHAMHQAAFQCAVCHHTIKDGKQSPYVAGMPIGKCEDCHFAGSSMPAGDKAGVAKLDTFKDAAHALCRNCHDNAKDKKPALQEKWTGCLPCHQ